VDFKGRLDGLARSVLLADEDQWDTSWPF